MEEKTTVIRNRELIALADTYGAHNYHRSM